MLTLAFFFLFFFSRDALMGRGSLVSHIQFGTCAVANLQSTYVTKTLNVLRYQEV